jgi:hypothetical protein
LREPPRFEAVSLQVAVRVVHIPFVADGTCRRWRFIKPAIILYVYVAISGAAFTALDWASQGEPSSDVHGSNWVMTFAGSPLDSYRFSNATPGRQDGIAGDDVRCRVSGISAPPV